MTYKIYLIGEDIFLQNALNALENMTNQIGTKNFQNNVLLGTQVIMFSVFAIEAVSNYILQKNSKTFFYDELKLRTKMNLIFSLDDNEIDWGSLPYQTFLDMYNWRNNLAHFKKQRQKGLVSSMDFTNYVPSTEKITLREDSLKVFSKEQCQKYYTSTINIITELFEHGDKNGKLLEDLKKNIFYPVSYVRIVK